MSHRTPPKSKTTARTLIAVGRAGGRLLLHLPDDVARERNPAALLEAFLVELAVLGACPGVTVELHGAVVAGRLIPLLVRIGRAGAERQGESESDGKRAHACHGRHDT